jgi:hypothetical protein
VGPIQKQFELILRTLKKKNARFALAGGYAASLYRKMERFTKDIDLLLWTEDNVIQDAKDIINELGLEAYEITEAHLKRGPMHKLKSRNTPVWMVSGRSQSKTAVPVDFILHLFPWMLEALERAQLNQYDIGFGWKIPVITPEDVLLAKFMALNDDSSRIDDISDIREIFGHTPISLPYLVGRMEKHRIGCPSVATEFVPDVIRKAVVSSRHGKK